MPRYSTCFHYEVSKLHLVHASFNSVLIKSVASLLNLRDFKINLLKFHVYLIQHYVIKFVSDLQQDCDFRRVLKFPLQIKLTAMV
jgi:hypothetical protein